VKIEAMENGDLRRMMALMNVEKYLIPVMLEMIDIRYDIYRFPVMIILDSLCMRKTRKLWRYFRL
jgi:hypothetical protein